VKNDKHVPVLRGPVLEGLNVRPDGCYVDATFGRGGHSDAIAESLGPEGRLIAIDRDPEAIAAVPDTLLKDPRFEIVRGEFAELEKIAAERDLLGQVDGVLLDLGVSSPQLDQAERGFSFMRSGPLDMRMDPRSGVSAAEWLAEVDEKTLKDVLRKNADEKCAGRIARAVVSARCDKPIRWTEQLVDIVTAAVPARNDKKHPATKTFQAIRMEVNNELGQLESALQAAARVLQSGGRLCVISFHSIEDRIVKRFMRDASRESKQYRGMPSVPVEGRATFRPIGKMITATAEEIAANVRARSARLRVAERI
jgi:16S rRNA (cytosine1402-N4)-methyltransferase